MRSGVKLLIAIKRDCFVVWLLAMTWCGIADSGTKHRSVFPIERGYFSFNGEPKPLSIIKGKKPTKNKAVIFGPESFEGSFPPTGWSQFNTGQSTMNWYKKADAGHQGSYVAWVDPDPNTNLYQCWALQTPNIDFSGCAGCSLWFYFKQSNNTNYWDWLYVWVAYQGGGPNDPTWTMIGGLCQSGANWDLISGDISPWVDSQPSIVFGFEYYSEPWLARGAQGLDYVYVTAASGGGNPNLKPFTPTGWSAPLICSVNPDTISEDTLYAGQPYYLSLAVKNEGTANVNDTFAIVVTKNDTLRFGWWIPNLSQGGIVRQKCMLDTIFTPGTYTMKVVSDPFSQIAESDETDNVWGKTFYWKTAGTPDIWVSPESLYYYHQISKSIKEVNGYWNANEVCVTVDISDFQIEGVGDGTQRINIPGFGHLGEGGVPYLPAKTFTIAIPPGAVVTAVNVNGVLSRVAGTYNIMPTPPLLPTSGRPELTRQIMTRYTEIKQAIYSSDAFYPEVLGKLDGTGGFRKYNLVDVGICPFSYNPLTGELRFTNSITIDVHYTLDADKLQEAKKLETDNLFEEEAMEIIYNYSQTRDWYTNNKNEKPTYDYVIITPSALTPACDTLVNWKTSIGYSVNVVTKEWINTNYSGNDIQQKIRNFLRDKYPSNQWGIKYVLIIGDNTDIPMRMCVPFNNDPDSPYNDTLLSPVPTDLYYAELTDPDNISWNKDGDSYYGEVGDASGGAGDDSPDYHADVHLGRIPWSDNSKISHICQKMVAFEQNTDISYKKASLLGGAMYNYYNENGTGILRTDGAEVMEDLMNDGIIERAKAITEYEKEGVTPSSYSCTYPITQSNLINQWQNKGIFNEIAHGWTNSFARKVWVQDNNVDSIPQDNEIAWYNGLNSTDAPSLDDNYPAIGFLGSCLCSYPELTNNLGAALLHQGSAGVVSGTRETLYRAGWSSATDGGSISFDYFFFKKLLLDTNDTHARVGCALDAARNAYAGIDVWVWAFRYINIYGFVLYGEPSLCHFGAGGQYLTGTMWVHNSGNGPLNISNISYTQNWIASVSPSSFFVSPGDSVGVSVLVNPVGLSQGWYYDTLKISSNDPNDPVYPERVVLQVVQTGVEEDISSDKSEPYLLLPGWPNPFTQETKIKIYIPVTSKVNLRIYDISGRLVRRLIEDDLEAREWSIVWDGKDEQGRSAVSGVYFVRLVVGENQLTKKLVLMK